MASTTPYIHPLAACEARSVGAGTRVWAFAQVMEGAVVGADCNIGAHAFIEAGARVGDRVTVKNGVMIWAGITVEDDVFLGPGALFVNDRTPRSPRMAGVPAVAARYASREAWLAPTTVGRGASVGAGAIIGGGLRIGAFAMIGAGANVTRDVPEHALVLGNPARVAGWVCRCGAGVAAAGALCPGCGA